MYYSHDGGHSGFGGLLIAAFLVFFGCAVAVNHVRHTYDAL